jgi:ATP-dependent DNA helicase RecQ
MHLNGIDKADVTRPLFITNPRNIENYYQEAGRSGRNGSYCVPNELPTLGKRRKTTHTYSPRQKNSSTVCTQTLVIFHRVYGGDQRKILNLNNFARNEKSFSKHVYACCIANHYQCYFVKKFCYNSIPSKELMRYMSLNQIHEKNHFIYT